MIQDSNETNDSLEPSNELSPPSGFSPKLGVREIQATWEMLVKFKQAIKNAHWSGEEVQAVAMGLQMVMQMEAQYLGQLEAAKREQKEALKNAKIKIQEIGGQVNGSN